MTAATPAQVRPPRSPRPGPNPKDRSTAGTPTDRQKDDELTEAAAAAGWHMAGLRTATWTGPSGSWHLAAQAWWNRTTARFEWDLLRVVLTEGPSAAGDGALPTGHSDTAASALQAAVDAIAATTRTASTGDPAPGRTRRRTRGGDGR